MGRKQVGLWLLNSAAFLLLAAGALATFQNDVVLDWWTADGGGISSGGNLTLSGSTGQADAGDMSGGNYTLSGGFWNPSIIGLPVATGYRIYLPITQYAP